MYHWIGDGSVKYQLYEGNIGVLTFCIISHFRNLCMKINPLTSYFSYDSCKTTAVNVDSTCKNGADTVWANM